MKKSIILILAVCLTTVTSFAQKFGHINGQSLVQHMPEYKVAEKQIDTLYNQYQDILKSKKEEYDGLVAKIQEQQAATNPATPKALIEKNLMKLQQLESEIYEITETRNQDVAAQQEEKLAPIQKKALDIVQQVGKEKGFTYIFDVSTGVLLYLNGEDITPLVCAKLGIPDYSGEEKAATDAPAPPKK
jgi:outer membrane protein